MYRRRGRALARQMLTFHHLQHARCDITRIILNINDIRKAHTSLWYEIINFVNISSASVPIEK